MLDLEKRALSGDATAGKDLRQILQSRADLAGIEAEEFDDWARGELARIRALRD